MRNLKATVAALLMTASIALPALAEDKPTPLFTEQAEVGLSSGQQGEAEWGNTRGIYTVQLRSWQTLLSSSGYALILVKAIPKGFETLPKCTRLRFHMEFKEQVHAHVRPTIRVEYLYEPKKGLVLVGRFDLDWNEYKNMRDPDSKDWYDIDLAKLLDEKGTKVKKSECRLHWIAIGGRELHREGLGKNGFLDVNIGGLSLSQTTDRSAAAIAVPIKVNTDVIKTNGRGSESWADKLDGTM